MGSPHFTVMTACEASSVDTMLLLQVRKPDPERQGRGRDRAQAQPSSAIESLPLATGSLQLRLLESQAAEDAYTFPSRDKGPLKSDTRLLNGICQGSSTLCRLQQTVSAETFPQADTVH